MKFHFLQNVQSGPEFVGVNVVVKRVKANCW